MVKVIIASKSNLFVQEYIARKIGVFVEEIEGLSKIAERYPQSAFAACSHCIMEKWLFIMRTVENINVLFQPLEDAISQAFIPSIIGRNQCIPDDEHSFHFLYDLMV